MPEKSKIAYIPSLDGMRGISIILVFIAHLGFERIVPGGLGVMLFFFISGYIITQVLINEYQKTNRINLKLFYTGRILRLYPPLLLMLCLVIPYLIIINYHFRVGEILACLLYYENYYFYYTGKGHLTLSILWSLAVEEHFYFLYPLLFIGFFKHTKKLIATFIALIIIALGFRIGGYMQFKNSADELERYCYVLTHTRFDSILFGCLASILLHSRHSGAYKRILSNKLLFILAVVIQIVCLVFRDPMFRYTVRYTLQGISFLIIVPAIINTETYTTFKQVFSSKILVGIGKVSYSVYLLHMLVVKAFEFLQIQGHILIYYICCIVGSAVLATLCYNFIEKPIQRFRKNMQLKPVHAPVVQPASNS